MNEGIGSRACAAMTDCSSDLSRTDERIAPTAKEVAAVVQPIFSIYRRCRVEQHRDPGDASAISLSSSTDLPIIVGSVVKMKPVTLPPTARSSRRSRCRSGRQRARKRWGWCAFFEAAPLWWIWCSKEGDQAIARRVPSRNVASTPRRQVA
jgi:hypothetical protein